VAVTVTHSTVATLPDEPGAEVNAAEWNANHSIAGLGTMAEANTTDYAALAGATFTGAVVLPDGLISAPSLLFTGDTATGWYQSGANQWAWTTGANATLQLQSNGVRVGSGGAFVWVSAASAVGGSIDTAIARAAANSLVFAGTGAAGAATSRTEINKAVTGIADATATAVFTVTVPNGAHSANVEVTLNGSIGAGGAIGANEATASIKYNVAIARTAGVNAVAVISAAYGSSGSAAVAGATSITVAGDLGAISGAVGAANTFTIRVTVTKGGGTSANHTCTAHAVLVNANASGVTIV
jgi:hypothetical protein